ncbi:MAG: cytochrome C oxidase subunit IV family protein [Bacillota bacterium]
MTTIASSQPAAAPHEHDAAHIVPPRVLLGVFATLLVLTVLTVAVTRVDLGAFNIWLALGIAVTKAALVALYFMHLRYDSPFYGVILIGALLFVVVFIGAAILDSTNYNVNYQPPSGMVEQ